jgi:acyl-CoA thioesterase
MTMPASPPVSFAEASALCPIGPGRYRITVGPDWFQGQGAFGGLTAAWLLRAMTDVVGEPARAPRELSGAFCARVRAGEAEIEAKVSRAGLNVSFASAVLLQRGKVAATASAVFSTARPAEIAFVDLSPPEVLPPARSPLWELPGGLPAYAEHFEIRHCFGVAPLGGTLGPECAVWVRHRVPATLDAPAATALLDCFAPAFFTRVEQRRPAGTVAWSVHFLADFPVELPHDAYCLLRVSSPVAAGGYSSEDDELWSAGGRLLARARQLVAAI